MWKLLRNFVLLALLLFGAAKLLLWVVGQQQAGALVDQLSPVADLSYTAASAGLDGRVLLTQVKLKPKVGPWHETVDAERLELQTPGAFWLLRRAVTHDRSLPEKLGIDLVDPHLPASALFDSAAALGWLGARTWVPFDAAGCGTATHFTDADYGRMGITPATRTVHLGYALDSEARTAVVEFGLRSEPFMRLAAETDVTNVDPVDPLDPRARAALGISSIKLDYTDLGYLARRNRYCAQQLGGSVAEFLGRHVAAVSAYVREHQVEIPPVSLEFYRKLAEGGGRVELVSIPTAGIAPARWADYPPQELLRFLNLTARHNDTPPIMFKLAFLAPEVPVVPDTVVVEAPATGTPAATTTVTPAATVTPATTATATTVTVTPAAMPPAPSVTTTVTATPPPATTTPPATTSPAAPAATTGTQRWTDLVATAPKPAPAAEKPKPVTPPPVATAAAPAATTPADVPVIASGLKPATAPTTTVERPDGLPASAPQPTGNSVSAMVWRGPMIERLPTKPGEDAPDYEVLPAQDVPAQIGRRIRVVTEGGKILEGVLERIDPDQGLDLRVRRETGEAHLFVPLGRVREVRLVRARS